MISTILKYFGLNKILMFIILGLATSTAVAGYLLKSSYQNNGEYKAKIDLQDDIIEDREDLIIQWKIANDASIEALNEKQRMFEDAQGRLLLAGRKQTELKETTDGLRQKISELDGQCLDTDLGDDYWLLIEEAATAARNATD